MSSAKKKQRKEDFQEKTVDEIPVLAIRRTQTDTDTETTADYNELFTFASCAAGHNRGIIGSHNYRYAILNITIIKHK